MLSQISTFLLPSRSAQPSYEHPALIVLNDVYRFAWFLCGSSRHAEELTERAFKEACKTFGHGPQVQDWRRSLLRLLLDNTGTRGLERPERHARRPPMWDELIDLPLKLRAILILDSLDLESTEIAWIVRTSQSEIDRQRAAALSKLATSD